MKTIVFGMSNDVSFEFMFIFFVLPKSCQFLSKFKCKIS